ncbi:DUF4342 domain-containing protein [Phosphitispora sp. TUW77]|uniref:DUF4342 domain-containing protein n=1 Tax=Phosphitispora sp. TUW77 TaxID=3152361 RepID=UPI003AB2E88D
MSDELEKLDIIRERLGISYREAKECLEDAGDDLVEALVLAEQKTKRNACCDNRWKEKGEEIFGELKLYLGRGNRTKIRLKREEKTIAEFPATAGAIGVLAVLASAPLAVAAGIGTVAAIANKVTLEVEKPDGIDF